MEEALVGRAGIPFRGISTGKLRGANPVKAARSLAAIGRGVRQSLAIIDEVGPQACFVTGGYVCAPVVIACALRKVPVLIYLPDMTPGWTIKWMSKIAQRVAVSFPEVAPHFGGLAPQGKAVVTGYPVRAELVEAATDRFAARKELARRLNRPLNEPALPLVLVWGGSQGSRNINQSTWFALARILPHAHVLHVVGERDWPLYESQRDSLSKMAEERYHPVPYLHDEMALALAAADLSVARAGASTLGEFPVAALPSILVPLVGVNQTANADLLAAHGGGVVIADEDLAGKLGESVVSLVNDGPRRAQMEENLRTLARPNAALNIAREWLALGTRGGLS